MNFRNGKFFKGSLATAILSIALFGAFTVSNSADAESWTFAVVGDTRTHPEIFKQVAENILKDETKPEMLFHTGDFVFYAFCKKQWKQFADIKAMFDGKIPFYPVAGNHEKLGTGNFKNYIKYAKPPEGKIYYSVANKDAGFVVLSTYTKGHEGSIDPEQVAWLKATLAEMKGKSRVIFAFIHHPLLAKDYYKHKEPVANADEIKKILSDAGVVAVFMGHEHRFDHTVDGGVHYLLTAGGGAPLYGTGEDAFNHYCRVVVGKDNVTIIPIGLDGKKRPEIVIELQKRVSMKFGVRF